MHKLSDTFLAVSLRLSFCHSQTYLTKRHASSLLRLAVRSFDRFVVLQSPRHFAALESPRI